MNGVASRSRACYGTKFAMPPYPNDQEMSMKWEIPTATDFRFGFEITMYIATR